MAKNVITQNLFRIVLASLALVAATGILATDVPETPEVPSSGPTPGGSIAVGSGHQPVPRSGVPATGTSAQQLYRQVCKMSDFTVIFDPDFHDASVDVDVDDVSAAIAIARIAQSARHFVTGMDDSTILVADDTPKNRRDNERLAIRQFVLENASVMDIDRTIRALIETRRLVTDGRSNAIVLRDTED